MLLIADPETAYVDPTLNVPTMSMIWKEPRRFFNLCTAE